MLSILVSIHSFLHSLIGCVCCLVFGIDLFCLHVCLTRTALTAPLFIANLVQIFVVNVCIPNILCHKASLYFASEVSWTRNL